MEETQSCKAGVTGVVPATGAASAAGVSLAVFTSTGAISAAVATSVAAAIPGAGASFTGRKWNCPRLADHERSLTESSHRLGLPILVHSFLRTTQASPS